MIEFLGKLRAVAGYCRTQRVLCLCCCPRGCKATGFVFPQHGLLYRWGWVSLIAGEWQFRHGDRHSAVHGRRGIPVLARLPGGIAAFDVLLLVYEFCCSSR